MVWSACSVPTSLEGVCATTGLSEDDVAAALLRLDGAGLLERSGLSRRALLQRVGVVAALVPLLSIPAAAAYAASSSLAVVASMSACTRGPGNSGSTITLSVSVSGFTPGNVTVAAVYPDKNGHTRQVTAVVANGGSTTLTLNKVASGTGTDRHPDRDLPGDLRPGQHGVPDGHKLLTGDQLGGPGVPCTPSCAGNANGGVPMTASGPRKLPARVHGLVSRDMGDECVVVDEATQQAHALSGLAAAIWRATDGGSYPEADQGEIDGCRRTDGGDRAAAGAARPEPTPGSRAHGQGGGAHRHHHDRAARGGRAREHHHLWHPCRPEQPSRFLRAPREFRSPWSVPVGAAELPGLARLRLRGRSVAWWCGLQGMPTRRTMPSPSTTTPELRGARQLEGRSGPAEGVSTPGPAAVGQAGAGLLVVVEGEAPESPFPAQEAS